MYTSVIIINLVALRVMCNLGPSIVYWVRGAIESAFISLVSMTRKCHNHRGGESRDFRGLKNGGFLSKPVDSGKRFFDSSANTDQIGMGFKADTPGK